MDNLIAPLLIVAKKEFSEKFRKPERDESTGLYVVLGNNDSPGKVLFSARV